MDEAVKALGDTLTGIANAVTRQILARDPNAESTLADLAGYCVTLRCNVPPVAWHTSVEDGALIFAQGTAPDAAATVAGDPPELFRWLLGNDAARVSIEGDRHQALHMRDALRSLASDSAAEVTQNLASAAQIGLQALRSGIEQLIQGGNPPSNRTPRDPT